MKNAQSLFIWLMAIDSLPFMKAPYKLLLAIHSALDRKQRTRHCKIQNSCECETSNFFQPVCDMDGENGWVTQSSEMLKSL